MLVMLGRSGGAGGGRLSHKGGPLYRQQRDGGASDTSWLALGRVYKGWEGERRTSTRTSHPSRASGEPASAENCFSGGKFETGLYTAGGVRGLRWPPFSPSHAASSNIASDVGARPPHVATNSREFATYPLLSPLFPLLFLGCSVVDNRRLRIS